MVVLVDYFNCQRWPCYDYELLITHLLLASVQRTLMNAFKVTMNSPLPTCPVFGN